MLKRTRAAYALIPGLGVLCAVPVFVIALVSPTWIIALPFLALAQMFVSIQSPSIAIVQELMPANRRAVATASLFLSTNLTAVGFGPLYIGFISDRALATYGDHSLQVAFWFLLPFFLISASFFYFASRALRNGAAVGATPVIVGAT